MPERGFLPALAERLERLRLSFAGQRGALALAIVGLLCGLLAGTVMLAFRALIELAHTLLLPHGQVDEFAALSRPWRFALPAAGALLITALFALGRGGRLRVGVVHVMERLAYFEGNMPFRHAVLQFFGSAVALAAGLSVGREGPAIHLGAASGSLLGQRLRFPNNSIRTLVACGTAAAIAASFNTPLAGVVFAMEVVMMEYTIAGFVPVILAAVSGASLNRLVYGTAPAFLVPQVPLASLWELPWIVATGVVIGAFAALFIVLLRGVMRIAGNRPWWVGFIAAGLLGGGCGMVLPQVMGLGYDSVNRILVGDYGLGLLAAIAALKMVATATVIGAGLPGGLIGPTLVIGSAAGGLLGLIGAHWAPVGVSHIALYAMLGMGAMMGATLRAPLAALVALLELTGNPNLILPGMLAIVAATLTTSELFRLESVFVVQMRELGLDYAHDPIAQHLRRTGVAAVMSRSFRCAPAIVSVPEAAALLAGTPHWIIVEQGESVRRVLLPASDLARHLDTIDDPDARLDLLEIPGKRQPLASIHPQATLHEARQLLQREQIDALCVERPIAPLATRIFGVLTRADIEAAYPQR